MKEPINPNVGIVEKLFEDFSRGDMSGIMAAFSEDICWTYPDGSPAAGQHRGKKEVLDAMAVQARAYPAGLQMRDLTVHGDRDRAFAEYKWSATNARGSSVDEHALVVFEIRDGLVVVVRDFNMGKERTACGSQPLEK